MSPSSSEFDAAGPSSVDAVDLELDVLDLQHDLHDLDQELERPPPPLLHGRQGGSQERLSEGSRAAAEADASARSDVTG